MSGRVGVSVNLNQCAQMALIASDLHLRAAQLAILHVICFVAAEHRPQAKLVVLSVVCRGWQLIRGLEPSDLLTLTRTAAVVRPGAPYGQYAHCALHSIANNSLAARKPVGSLESDVIGHCRVACGTACHSTICHLFTTLIDL